jgi:DNA-binding NarL/FixJ family response regulator
MFRKGIVELMRTSGQFEIVAEAGNGQELIDQIDKLENYPDVCLLDVNMPVLDGYKTLVKLKESYPLMKFLILSMNGNEFAIIKMLRNGANGYLLKEDDPEELKRAVECVADNEFYHSELTSPHLRALRKGGDKYKPVVLNANEQTFLELCCSEMVYKEIAKQMGLSVRTVEGYRDDLFQKLNVNTRTGLVIYALKHGMVNL